MDCIFKITNAVKKIGFVILLAELAVIAYMIIALKQYRLYHSNDTASLAWLQVSLFTWLAIPV